MELFLPIGILKMILPLLAIVAAVFVITTKNAIISVFNLIVLYILVAFYLIYIGITYLGISYIVVYIGAIAILFLFVIMMIDIEVVEKRSNNYLPLLFLLLGGFFFTLKNILYNIGIVKMKSLSINIVRKPVINDNLFNISAENLKLNSLKEERDNLLVPDLNERSETKVNPLDFEKFSDEDKELMTEVMKSIKENNIKDITDMDGFDERRKERMRDLLLENELNSEISGVEVKVEDNLESVLLEETKLNLDIISDNKLIGEGGYLWDLDIKFNKLFVSNYEEELQNYNYLLVVPNWDLAVNRVTQISAIGDVLYTVYHSYIYIISVLLLLGMIGAIILTADSPQEVKVIRKVTGYTSRQRQAENNIFLAKSNKNSGLYNLWSIIFDLIIFIIIIIIFYLGKKLRLFLLRRKIRNQIIIHYGIIRKNPKNKSDVGIFIGKSGPDLDEIKKDYARIKKKIPENEIEIQRFYVHNMEDNRIMSKKEVKILSELLREYNKDDTKYIRENKSIKIKPWGVNIIKEKIVTKNSNRHSLILPFFEGSNFNTLHTEGIIGNLFYFIVATLIVAALLLFINSYFSLSIKYLDKGGGFECGFTSFVQTRERFNVIFYRVSLLFLVFDLEIILIFPYIAIYQKYQNISKNNVLAFLYILIVGFIYELKEGALNIVKKAHSTEINNLK